MTRSIVRTITTAIAIAALAAPGALARPAAVPPAVAAHAAAELHKHGRLAQINPQPDASRAGRAGQPAAGAGDDRGVQRARRAPVTRPAPGAAAAGRGQLYLMRPWSRAAQPRRDLLRVDSVS